MDKKKVVEHGMDAVELLALRADRLYRLIEMGTPQDVYADEVQLVKDAARHVISIIDSL